jgi:hypothetical protein
MNKIVVVNQTYLCDPRLDTALAAINSVDRRMLGYFCEMSKASSANQIGLLSRAGKNIFPFSQEILQLTDSVMPAYDPTFNQTWEQVTDQRACELEQRLLTENKKLVVMWSGGIDSTCILAAILKNFKPSALEQTIVACTAHGIVENPVFYTQHIVPNFKIVDTNYFINNVVPTASDVLIVEGFAADVLNMSMTPSLDVCMGVRDSKMLSYSWRRQPDALIQYLAKVTGSKEFAQWYYDRTQASVESVDVPIETYFDFMWWIGFNCEYYSWALHSWFFCYRHLNIPYQDYQSKFIGWYRNDGYQQWAMKNTGAEIKYGKDLGSFKLWPKKYIYDYDRNEYYYRYKTKISSPGRDYNSLDQKPFAITDDFKILYLEQDLDRIIELLPTCITP